MNDISVSINIDLSFTELVEVFRSEFRDPRVTEILALFDALKIQGETLMAQSAESVALLKRIDAFSTKLGESLVELAADIQTLIDRPDATAVEMRAALEPRVTTLEAIGDALSKLGADTNAPIPPDPPVEPAPEIA